MNTKTNFNKGETNVKNDDTMSVMNVNVFDVTNAGVARSGKGEWDEFELIGASNKQEGEYKPVVDEEMDRDVLTRRIQNSRVGRKILTLSSLDWRTA